MAGIVSIANIAGNLAAAHCCCIGDRNECANPLPGLKWHALDNSIPNSGTGSTGLFFSPRIGVAWDVTGSGKTVLRGGFGVYRFHDAETDVDSAFQETRGMRDALLAGFGNATLAGISSLHLTPGTYGNAGGTESFAAVPTIFGLDPKDHAAPVTNNYSLSFAQQFPHNTILQISYVGNNSNSLMNNGTTQSVVLNNVNAIPIGAHCTFRAARRQSMPMLRARATPPAALRSRSRIFPLPSATPASQAFNTCGPIRSTEPSRPRATTPMPITTRYRLRCKSRWALQLRPELHLVQGDGNPRLRCGFQLHRSR